MDFQLTEEQKMFQTMVRDFATNEVKPMACLLYTSPSPRD